MPDQMSKCFHLKTSIMILSVHNVTYFQKKEVIVLELYPIN